MVLAVIPKMNTEFESMKGRVGKRPVWIHHMYVAKLPNSFLANRLHTSYFKQLDLHVFYHCLLHLLIV